MSMNTGPVGAASGDADSFAGTWAPRPRPPGPRCRRDRRRARCRFVLASSSGCAPRWGLYAFEVVLLLALAIAVLAKGGAQGLSATPFHWPGGSGTKDIFIAFSLAVLAFGGFEAAAPLAEETRNPRRNVPLAVIGTVVISGILYVFCSYALIIAFGPGHIGALASDPNPFHTAASRFISPLAPLITWIFLTSVTSSYVAANTQTARVIFAGARGGLWARSLASVSPLPAPRAAGARFRRAVLRGRASPRTPGRRGRAASAAPPGPGHS